MRTNKRLSKVSIWLLNRPKFVGLMVFLFLLTVIVLMGKQRFSLLKENTHHEMINILSVVKQNIEQAQKNSYTSVLSLSLTIDDKGVPQNFSSVAARLLDSNSHYQALQLVPNGIIKYIYPLKGNEGALGYDVFTGSSANVLRAHTAMNNRKMYFIGPDRLQQGGVGIVGRLPVYINNKFWGFSAVVIKLEKFINEAGIYNDNDNRFYFQFSKVDVIDNKEEFFLSGPGSFADHEFESVTFPDGSWKLYIIQKSKNEISFQVFYTLVFGVALAIFCSLLVAELLKKPAQLQRMVDAAQEDLMKSFGMVMEQNKRLINFSYIVSHNLRSHTSNIQAISSLIEHSDSEKERNELTDLLKSVSGALNETLLNLNQVVNIQTSIDVIKPLNLKNYADKTIAILQDQIVLKNAEIINYINPQATVNFNPAYLESIMLNFISNAIRYSHTERTPVIKLSTGEETGQVLLIIEDNGIGIDLDKHGNQLFGMYKTFTDNRDSRGIGLFITKNQIETMGGSVTVSSVLNEGTVFTIHFSA